MKRIETTIDRQKLYELMDAIYYQPFAHLVHFGDHNPQLSLDLATYCEAHEYHYQLNSPSKVFVETMREQLASIANAKAFTMPIDRPKYLIGGKLYDYAILTLEVAKPQRLAFLKKLHAILRGHAKVVIFVPVEDRHEREAIIDALEEALYVATSTIEDICEGYDVILSNKMHGWGD